MLQYSIWPVLRRRAESFFAQSSLTPNRFASSFRLPSPRSYAWKNFSVSRSFEYGSGIWVCGQSPLLECNTNDPVHSN